MAVSSTENSLLCAEAVDDPYTYFGRIREREPVHWHVGGSAWLLTRFDDVRAALKEERLSSDRVDAIFDEKLTPEQRAERAPTYRVLSDWMVFKDPPAHTRLRGLVQRSFTPRAIDQLAPRVATIVDGVLDSLGTSGEVDVVRDVAYPIPAMVIAEMLGVPVDQRDTFKRWSDDVSTLVFGGARTKESRSSAQRGLVALEEYLGEQVRKSAHHPSENLISGLVRARDDDESLTEQEVVHTCVLLLFAGHDTTATLIGNGFHALMSRPDLASRLVTDPSIATAAVEELNRFDGPAKMAFRRADADIVMHGRTIRRGDQVILVQSSANRDPRQFSDPDRLDFDRPENRHLAFGFGLHVCLGAPLARLVTRITLPRLIERLPEPRLTTDRLQWRPILAARGLEALPIRYGA